MDNKSLGIYIPETKTFYYLESGRISVTNTIDRLRSALVNRGIITFDPTRGTRQTQNYEIISIKQAQLDDRTIEAIHISQHTKNMVEKTTTTPTGSWGGK